MRPETLAKCAQIPEMIAQGMSLREACAASHVSLTTFQQALAGVRELAIGYARAREIRCEIMGDELLEIADNKDLDTQQARNMLDVRRWLMSKLSSRLYGDRVDLNVSSSVSIVEAQAAARARVASVLPVCYPELGERGQDTIDAHVCDEVPTDCKSEDTDIFS